MSMNHGIKNVSKSLLLYKYYTQLKQTIFNNQLHDGCKILVLFCYKICKNVNDECLEFRRTLFYFVAKKANEDYKELYDFNLF